MSNTIVVQGFVSNLKRYNNDDGSVKLLFTISSKTNDPKRYNEQNNNRDFFSVDLYISQARAKLADYIQDGKVLSVTGIPYQSMAQDGKTRYHNIKTYADFIAFMPTPNPQNQGQQNQGQQNPQQNQQQPPQGQQPQGNPQQQQPQGGPPPQQQQNW